MFVLPVSTILIVYCFDVHFVVGFCLGENVFVFVVVIEKRSVEIVIIFLVLFFALLHFLLHFSETPFEFELLCAFAEILSDRWSTSKMLRMLKEFFCVFLVPINLPMESLSFLKATN